MFLLVAAGANPQVSERDDQTGPQPITSPKAALERALAYTGLEQTMDTIGIKAEEVAKLVVARDSTTPFISDRIDGQEVWCVTFSNVKLNLEGCYPSAIANQCPKTFEIIIDSIDGSLLCVKAWCEDERHGADSLAVYAADALTKELDSLQGFAKAPPAITLLDALSIAKPSNALFAKELHAACVMYGKSGGSGYSPVWVIIGRDVPTIEFGGPHELAEEVRREHNKEKVVFRTSVDAMSGEFMGASGGSRKIPLDSKK